jgi:membrane protein
MSRLRWIALIGSISVAAGFRLEHMGSETRARLEDRLRGRLASSPFQMTWLGWQDVLQRTWREAYDDRLMSVAASVAFWAVLALAPGVSVLVSIYGLFADPASVPLQLSPFTALLPAAAQQLIEEQAMRLAVQPRSELSLNLLLGLAVATWSATAAIKGMFDGLNVIYGEVEKRSFLLFNSLAILTTLGAVGLLALALFIIAVLPVVLAGSAVGQALESTGALLRWPAFYAVGVLSIAVLYWIGPSRKAARFIWVLPGAMLAALLWAAASALFSWYVTRLGNYASSYGSLATVVVFMTWLWLSASVILLGAELNAELEHQTQHDTTFGEARDMGQRGAVVADQMGESVAGTMPKP